jgi:hypothetical protein
MRIFIALFVCFTMQLASATSFKRPDRPATAQEQIELARYDQALIESQRRLKIRISADFEVQQMLDYVIYDEDHASTEEVSAAAKARYALAQRDELAALIWASDAFEHVSGLDMGPLDAEEKAQIQRLKLLIARWQATGSVIWKLFDALLHRNSVEQKQLLTIALKKPLHSAVTQRARALALRYFELTLLEPEPALPEALAVYRPSLAWMRSALLATGGIDFEGLLATQLLEPFCDSKNPSKLLSAAQCQSLLRQTQLGQLMTPSELPAENLDEPTLSQFMADQQLLEQVQTALEPCADTPFFITLLRATSTADWRRYMRKLLDAASCPEKRR